MSTRSPEEPDFWICLTKVSPRVYLYILRVKNIATGETEKVVKKFAVIR